LLFFLKGEIITACCQDPGWHTGGKEMLSCRRVHEVTSLPLLSCVTSDMVSQHTLHQHSLYVHIFLSSASWVPSMLGLLFPGLWTQFSICISYLCVAVTKCLTETA
jgi:hypothetical protein